MHAGGAATHSFAVPSGPLLQGFTLYGQALSLDAGSPNGIVALSNGVELILN